MRLLILIGVLFAGGLARAEDAKPFNPADYPSEVQKALHYAHQECQSQGGGAVSFAPDTVREIDLTGDGRDDYVVDFRDTKCDGSEAAYCGSGGCVMNVLVTLPNGNLRRVFDGYVRNYEIEPTPMKRGAARTMRFELHGGYCGGHGSPSCFKEKAISMTPFAFKMP
ncbi:hypothetical protein [Bradyrhizobium sp. Ec3.3]|uniref:hypothetical protein n=1 Tax=Bradyrhizobium sp. Ec3.3 TaxID=189753 RepID=UPI00048155BE|nr:hypothetical protein [Bradyrhizobium sp. Ec3.3]